MVGAALLPLQASDALVLTAVLGVMALVLVAGGLRELVRWVRLWRVTPTHVVDIEKTSGRVLVSGVARRAEETLRAPATDEPCLAYDWRATAMVQGPGFGGDRRLTVVEQGRDAVPFLVDDGTGEVLVDPAGATFRLAEEFVADPARRPRGEEPGGLLATLRQAGEFGPRRYFEGRLDEGETVVVRGRVRRDPDQRLVAGRVGASIGGGRLVVADGTRPAAAWRVLLTALLSLGAGLVVAAVLVVAVLG